MISSAGNRGLGIFMAFAVDGASAPNTVNSSVARTREYLTANEVEDLMATARKSSRYGHRDASMIRIAYRHGLRASEICDLLWHQVELNAGRLHVRRTKRGTPSVHPIQGDELRALRRLQREQPAGPYIFMSERGGPTPGRASTRLLWRLGERTGMAFPIHPHMLRHGCGYALANAGHDTRAIQAWMGHKNIQHTVRYTELAKIYRARAGSVQGFLARLVDWQDDAPMIDKPDHVAWAAEAVAVFQKHCGTVAIGMPSSMHPIANISDLMLWSRSRSREGKADPLPTTAGNPATGS